MTENADDLQKLENQFNFLLHFANDIILLMDADGNVLKANEVAAQAYGWRLDDLLKLNIRDLRDPSTLEELPKQLKLTAETGALFETRHKRRDGSIFPVEVSSRLFEHEGRTYRQSIVRDITQRYLMQAKLERDAKCFEGLLQLHEQAANLQEKEFMQFGLAWVEKLTGSKIAFTHFVKDDQKTVGLIAWSAASGGNDCTDAGEEYYPVADAGRWADALRKLQPVIFNDYVNNPDRHGLPEGDSQLIRLISVPVIEDNLIRMVIGVGNKETDYDEEDVEIAKLFGNSMWRIIRRKRAESELNANLEQQHTLNTKLEEAQNYLLQSEKMVSLGQLAAGVAHELNNPIGFVYSNMGTLETYVNDIFVITAAYEEAEKTQDKPCPALDQVHKLKQEKDYAYIKQDIFQLMVQSKDGLARMRKIVQDLKNFSHVGEDVWNWVDLHKGLESTLNIVWNELKYKCQVVKEYGQLPQVYCMPSQVNQVFMNLLVNASQAIETSGVITIRTGRESNEVWVEIEDTGKGIASENIQHIFDPFFTTKPVGVGTGLGLSLSYGIIQKHQGRIEVKSQLGKGTAMRIYLPVKPFSGGSVAT